MKELVVYTDKDWQETAIYADKQRLARNSGLLSQTVYSACPSLQKVTDMTHTIVHVHPSAYQDSPPCSKQRSRLAADVSHENIVQLSQWCLLPLNLSQKFQICCTTQCDRCTAPMRQTERHNTIAKLRYTTWKAAPQLHSNQTGWRPRTDPRKTLETIAVYVPLVREPNDKSVPLNTSWWICIEPHVEMKQQRHIHD